MSYLPADLPAPTPDEDDAPFWAHCNERRLMFQQCPRCRTLVHPPLPVCPGCQSLERAWVEAPAQAQLFSFTWVQTAAHESVKLCLPYNVAIVEFPDMPAVRLISNVIDVERGALRVGDRLALAWEQGWQGQMLPRFRQVKNET